MDRYWLFDFANGPCMNPDEEQIGVYCVNNSKAIIVSGNTVVSHLLFGLQNKGMAKHFE